MAKKSNGTKALVVGTVLGLVAGAAYALWKTPMSGKDLRSKLSTAASEATESLAGAGAGLSDKVLHAVETTLAPIVGVELGKTANGSEPVTAEANETGPITAAAPAESNGHAISYGTSSIRAQRFAWGTPAPEATKVAPVTPPAPAAAPVEPVKPVEAAVAKDSVYGTDTIRSQRYGWGTPAPEATKTAPVAPQTPEAAPVEPVKNVEAPAVPAASYSASTIRAQRSAWGAPAAEATKVAPVANATVSAPVSVSVEETREMEPVAAGASVDGMHPFPKLGGLE